MISSQNIAILILAAGASKRIGTPKQLLKWGNSTLLGHTIETAQQLNPAKIVVVLGAFHEKIEAEIKNYSTQIIINESWELGLGSTIANGIDHLIQDSKEYDAVMILLSDQPLIIPYYLKAMIQKFEIGKQEIIASSYNDGKFGVPALFDKKYFLELTLLQDDKGAKKLIDKYSEFVTSVDMRPLLTDIDTLDDYNSLYSANHQ